VPTPPPCNLDLEPPGVVGPLYDLIPVLHPYPTLTWPLGNYASDYSRKAWDAMPEPKEAGSKAKAAEMKLGNRESHRR